LGGGGSIEGGSKVFWKKKDRKKEARITFINNVGGWASLNKGNGRHGGGTKGEAGSVERKKTPQVCRNWVFGDRSVKGSINVKSKGGLVGEENPKKKVTGKVFSGGRERGRKDEIRNSKIKKESWNWVAKRGLKTKR